MVDVGGGALKEVAAWRWWKWRQRRVGGRRRTRRLGGAARPTATLARWRERARRAEGRSGGESGGVRVNLTPPDAHPCPLRRPMGAHRPTLALSAHVVGRIL